MKKMSLIIDHTDPVCISVRGNSNVAAPVQHIILKRSERCSIGGRKLSSKQRIVAFMNGFYLTSGNRQNSF